MTFIPMAHVEFTKFKSVKSSGGLLETISEKRRDTTRAKAPDATTKALNLYADTPPKGEMFKNK